jgi:light-regulated signal transduction histidine kinase (bacteriophytochrome)
VHAARDGSRYPVQVSATHVAIDGHDFGFLISRDLSEQVRQEAEIRELNATLEQRVRDRTAELADANGELEAFAYSVSHDLRAPLNHLTTYAESLAEVGPDDRAEALRLAGKIVERSAYMNDLVDALLVLSRVSRVALVRMKVDVSEIAADIADEHRKLDPARDVAVSIQPGMHAAADPMLVRTLLENLIGNAWKYSSREPHARIEVSTEAVDGGGTAFVVRDNGAGFDPRYAARLFGPFVRLHTQAEFKGNGVGLATARRIVSRHGGRIWAESRPGAGATFRFTLP